VASAEGKRATGDERVFGDLWEKLGFDPEPATLRAKSDDVSSDQPVSATSPRVAEASEREAVPDAGTADPVKKGRRAKVTRLRQRPSLVDKRLKELEASTPRRRSTREVAAVGDELDRRPSVPTADVGDENRLTARQPAGEYITLVVEVRPAELERPHALKHTSTTPKTPAKAKDSSKTKSVE
jgi:hypothetical protein